MEALFVTGAIVALLLLSSAAWQALAGRADFRRHPPPGRLVDLGSHRLHILAMGEGSPAVVMDSGLPGSVLSWCRVQPEVARFARAVSYDRAGLGWSDAGPLPRTAARIVEELHALLERARIPPPYVLVGHSFGGLTMRLFAARYPREMDGMVLVDPIGPREWLFPTAEQKAEVRGGARLCRRGAWLARLGVARWIGLLVRLGALRAVRVAVAVVSSQALGETGSMLAPLEKLPPELRAIVPLFWLQPKFYRALSSQMESLRASAEQVAAAAGAAGSWPVVVLSSGSAPPRRRSEQEMLVKSSLQGKHVMVASSGHWIQLDEPQAVVAAIRAVIEAARDAASRS